ncbi:hypothetical protein [Luteibacter aegosomatissinici]|uniref:hypothetical protein n=1 Tax=Luteibacter aegosomatissinici TaxID=2911539 RepID=UPI001FFB5432|nr:hypothetical protein [Luteibacter aegosomatissinici]UPG93909.1 hypothetical protein L2Y97_19050 [Luteibacter aegosomatissinici]
MSVDVQGAAGSRSSGHAPGSPECPEPTLKLAMIRLLGLFVSMEGQDTTRGFFTTVFVTIDTFPVMRQAARDALLARMARHGVVPMAKGPFRTLCVMVSMSSVEMDSDDVREADGFSFFRQGTLLSRISGAIEGAWRRWRHPDRVLV